jgi:nucleoid-associated protein YgaU
MQKIGKEIKIGLAVIGVLVAAFGYILFRRLSRPEDGAAPAPASAAAIASAKTAQSSDKPTVVAATDSARPADAATDPAASSGSLFSSQHLPAADATGSGSDSGTGPRGSFIPPANSGTAAGDGNNGIIPRPEDRFSQFGRHDDSSSPAKNGTTTGASPPVAATDNSPKSHNPPGGDATHSLFTAGNNTPPAEAMAGPSAIDAGRTPSDPFQRKSASSGDALVGDPNRHSASPLDTAASSHDGAASAATAPQSGLMPVDPSAPPQASASDPRDGNPLRQSHDATAQPASATTPAATALDAPHSAFGAPTTVPTAAPAYSAAQTVPPPISPNLIAIPSTQAVPSDPVRPPQSVSAQSLPAQPVPDQPLAAQSLSTQPLSAQTVSTQPMSAQPTSADAQPHRAGQYVVQPNDNYWTVSEKVYGTGGYFKAIYEHNRRQHSQSDRLQVGDVLDVPDETVLQQAYPQLCPKSGRDAQSAPAVAANVGAPPGMRLYSVADGDTLYEIARRELGRASRWGEIYQLNHDQLGNDFGYLRPGTQLLIPSDGGAPSMAREPGGTLQR